MADENPVVVNPSPLVDQLKALLRAIVLLAGGFGLTKFLPPEWLAFIQSDAFWPAITTVLSVGAVIWSQIETRIKKQTLVAAANAAPNKEFVVTETK